MSCAICHRDGEPLCEQCAQLAAIRTVLEATETNFHDSLSEPFLPEVKRLVAEVVAGGGDVSHWDIEFRLVEPYIPERMLLIEMLIQIQNERDPATWSQLPEPTHTGRAEQASLPFDV